MLSSAKPYREVGNQYFLKRDEQKVIARLARQTRELGYEIQPREAA